jgi:integrase
MFLHLLLPPWLVSLIAVLDSEHGVVRRRAGSVTSNRSRRTSRPNDLVGAFLARHRVDEATVRKLRSQLKHATAAFGDRRIETLTPIELDVWRSQLPARSAHYMFQAFRQVLEYAVAMGLLDTNPTARIRNTRASVERRVEAISAEMDPRFAAIPVVLVGTGPRPEELFALERRDVDLDAGVLSVERVFSQRVLKDCRKSSRQRRRVPLRQRVVDALRAQPPRLDTPLLFPAARGGHIDSEKVPGSRVGTCVAGCACRAQARLRLSPHVRELGASGRGWPVPALADHGHEHPATRPHLWASARRFRGADPWPARRQRRRSRTERGLSRKLKPRNPCKQA